MEKNYEKEIGILKSTLVSSEDLMYMAKYKAVKAMHDFIKATGKDCVLNEPIEVEDVVGVPHSIGSIGIDSRNNVCFIEEGDDSCFGQSSFDTPTVIELMLTVVNEMNSVE